MENQAKIRKVHIQLSELVCYVNDLMSVNNNYLLLLVVLDTLWIPLTRKLEVYELKILESELKCTWHYNTACSRVKYCYFLSYWHIIFKQYIFYFFNYKMFHVGLLDSIYFYFLFLLKEFNIKYV